MGGVEYAVLPAIQSYDCNYPEHFRRSAAWCGNSFIFDTGQASHPPCDEVGAQTRYHPESHIRRNPTLAEQGIHQDSECACLWTKVSSVERSQVVRCYCSGESLVDRQLLIWESLEDLTISRDYVNPNFRLVSLPGGLQRLTLDDGFEHVLKTTPIPSSLHTLTFGDQFNENLENVFFPYGLQHLLFGRAFNQSLEYIDMPSDLLTLSFGHCFNQSLQIVFLPSHLQTLTFGSCFDNSLEKVTLPRGLQILTFGDLYNQSLENVDFPNGLQTLTFGKEFTQSLMNVSLPVGLQSLTLSSLFSQSVDDISWQLCNLTAWKMHVCRVPCAL